MRKQKPLKNSSFIRRDKNRTQGRKYPVSFYPKADPKLKKLFQGIGVPEATAFIPDDFQVEAVEKIIKSDVLVSAPTGSGKTWIAVQAMKKISSEGKRAWYASPLKALSNSKYHEFEEVFGKENVGVITGDRKENTDARIVVGTTEILRNQLYDSMNKSSDFNADLVVLDEAHYLGDKDRGVVWEEVMIYLPARVRLLMLSATIPNDNEIAGWLINNRHLPCHVVHSEKRPVPIHPLYLLPDGEILPLSAPNGISPKIDAFFQSKQNRRSRWFRRQASYSDILNVLKKFNLLPAVFFLKSRSDCNNAVYSCKNHFISDYKSRQIKKRISELLDECPFLSNHPQIECLVKHGVGSHHGGQLPHWKVIIEKLMNEGYLDAIFSTSTVAAGVNFPARTVVLAQSDRFNGKEFVDLSSTELHQATGRAGRRGKDKIGFALMLHGPFQNPYLINKLLATPSEPIQSQLQINFSMCLNLLLSQTPAEICKLIDVSFAAYQKKNRGSSKVLKKGEIVSESYENPKKYLCNEFYRHLDFLVMNGFSEKNGALTSDGIWASKLRLDHPLIIAESIRKGLLNGLTPEVLSAIIAVFVNDKVRDLDLDKSNEWDKNRILKPYYKMKGATEKILSLKKQHGFTVPQIQFWPAAAVYNWACGKSWDDVIRLTSIDEGDLAMMVFRTADNLRQLSSLDKTHPVLAEKSRKSIKLLLREPVVIPT